MITLTINDQVVKVDDGTTVAAAIMNVRLGTFRRSVTGDRRAPLCGMGICFECRVSVDGAQHTRSCTILARDGMVVVTDE